MAVCGQLIAVAVGRGFRIVKIVDDRIQPWKTLEFEFGDGPGKTRKLTKISMCIFKYVFRHSHQLDAFDG